MPFIKPTTYLLLALLSVCITTAQDQKNPPKIGLVLSGGGAKGLAHIGVLKVLEDAGVQINYVAGTSMGAIVGGLYASGYTAAQLDSIFRTNDLVELIQDNVPRSAKNFYEKDDDERYAITLPFDHFKVSFPEGLTGGRNIYHKLVQLLHPVRNTKNFDQLPIPFLCVATDIENGKAVILEKGYLPEAMMASGALPSLFEPAEIDGKILIDGGVVNNFPVEELKKRNIDYIIGVDVQDSLVGKDNLSSATEILFQINNYRSVAQAEEKKKMTNLYIKPEVQDYTVLSFDKADEIIESGELAANKYLKIIQDLGSTFAAKSRNKTSSKIPDSLNIDHLVILGNENFSRGYVKGKLRLPLDKNHSFEELNQGLNNLAATKNFKALRYTLKEDNGSETLSLFLRENPNKMFLKLSAHYNDLFKSAALINITKKNFLFKDDLASFDFILGDNLRYQLQYYLDRGSYWSFGFNSWFNTFEQSVPTSVLATNFSFINNPNLREISLDFTEITNQVYLETNLKEEFALRLGIEHEYLQYSTKTFTDTNQTINNPERFYFEDGHYYSTYGQLTLDTYNDKYFPTQGLYFKGDFHLYLLSSDFNNNFKEFSVAQARMGGAFNILPNLSANLETEGGFKLGTSRVTSYDFLLGGIGSPRVNNIIPFAGYEFLSLTGNSFVKAMAKLDYQLSPKSHLLFLTNMANIEDDIFRTGEWFTAPDYLGFGIGYGLESFLGPIQVYYTWNPQNRNSGFFFSVGYWF